MDDDDHCRRRRQVQEEASLSHSSTSHRSRCASHVLNIRWVEKGVTRGLMTKHREGCSLHTARWNDLFLCLQLQNIGWRTFEQLCGRLLWKNDDVDWILFPTDKPATTTGETFNGLDPFALLDESNSMRRNRAFDAGDRVVQFSDRAELIDEQRGVWGIAARWPWRASPPIRCPPMTPEKNKTNERPNFWSHRSCSSQHRPSFPPPATNASQPE